jgi:hypothetical protein
MRRAIFPALLLLAIGSYPPREREATVDPGLAAHLRALEDWAGRFEMTESIPLPALAQWESMPPELFPLVLIECAPFYKEFDAVWSDPLSREHLRDGCLYRPDEPRVSGTRECLNLLAARAIHTGRDLRDPEACQRACEQTLAYAHSLGTDDMGFMLGWMGEGILASALQKMGCVEGLAIEEITNRFGKLDVPRGIERLVPRVRETYAQRSRDLLALAAR